MNLAEGAFPSPPDRFNPIFVADTFLSPAEHALVEIPRVRGSRFIGEVYPVVSAAAAGARIDQVRARESKATHHCWAWRIGIGEIAERSSDDGEPSGTAGAPILRQIQGRDLTQTLVVVTRYYGGTKLGTGGLVRSYGEAASAVLDAVPVAERTLAAKVELRFAYGDTAAATAVIHRFDADVIDQQYAEDVLLTIRVRKSLTSDLSTAFMDALGGRGEVALLDD